MKTVRYLGPGDRITYRRGMRNVAFEKGAPVEVDDDFADELLGKAPDVVFELVTASGKGVGE